MSVRIDAKPEFPTYQPPAWATEAADKDLAAFLRTQAAQSGHILDRPTLTCAVQEDPDFKTIERATSVLIVVFVLYMAAQFVRAWLEGRL